MPKKIGKYELGKTLGTGTFSKVKLGQDCEDGSQYAVKIIDKAQLAKEHMEEQLKREIAVMKLLKHPNIVSLTEVLQTAKHIYLILELVTGGELFDKIVASRKFEEPVARTYFQQMILGLYYCHDQGIAHRDLKPENLLLSGDDVLKISDFGLSNLQRGGAGQGGTLLQTVCGTPNYVAPEVLKERGYNGITADIWSCGVILFVMLAGYLPFEDPNMNALFNKIERGEYRMARHFTEQTKDLINKMLQIQPEQRVTLDQVIEHVWFQKDFDNERLKLSKGRRLRVGHDVPAVAHVDDPGAASPSAMSPKPSTSMCALALLNKLTSHTLDILRPGGAVAASKTLVPPSEIQLGLCSRFAVKGSRDDTITRATQILSELKGNPKVKKDMDEIKGFFNAPKGLLTYIVTCQQTILGDQLTFVEVKRGRGDPSDLRAFVRDLAAGFEKQGALRCKLL